VVIEYAGERSLDNPHGIKICNYVIGKVGRQGQSREP
jgi:uncharacterized protein YwbE